MWKGGGSHGDGIAKRQRLQRKGYVLYCPEVYHSHCQRRHLKVEVKWRMRAALEREAAAAAAAATS